MTGVDLTNQLAMHSGSGEHSLYWIDAHNHLQDPALDRIGSSFSEKLPNSEFVCLVNGTSPSDWDQVARECYPERLRATNQAAHATSSTSFQATTIPADPQPAPETTQQSGRPRSCKPDLVLSPIIGEFASGSRFLAAFGLHPWKLNERTPDWSERLDSLLSLPNASLGEVGLDRWIQNNDFDEQVRVLHAQLELIENRDIAISFHCLKAWNDFRGQVGKWLSKHPHRFLLHAYSGPVSEVPYWLDHGAWFSFSPYFLHPRKQAVRDLFKTLPLDRLLVETDAPSMSPPALPGFQILQSTNGEKINLPANLIPTYHALAELRGLPLDVLQRQIQNNFHNFYFAATETGGATGR